MARVYESAIKIGATVSSAFRRDTQNAASALLKLGDATKRLKDAEKSAAAYRKLDDAVKRSKAKYDQATSSLRRLQEAEKAAGGATKESTQWQKAGARAVAAAAREMDRATTAAGKNAKALRDLGIDTSKLTAEQHRLARATKLSEAKDRLFGTHKGEKGPLFQKLGQQASAVSRDVAVLGTAATVAGGAMVGLMLKSLHAADEIGDTSDKIGISAKALQELRYGAQQSGAEAEELDKALKKMLVTVGHFKAAKPKAGGGGGLIPGLEKLDAGEGGDAATETDPFKRIGLNAKKLAALKPEEQFKKIAAGMKTLKTQADRAAVSTAIFGKAAQSLDPFLREGPAGIEKLSKAANQYGGVLSQDVIDAADETDKAMRDARMAIGGLTNTLGAALLPTATKVFKEFAQWVAKNRTQIKEWAATTAKWIEQKGLPALLKFAAGVKELAGSVIHGATWLANFVGGWDRLAIILAGLRLAPLAKTMGEIAIEGTKATIALLKFAAANNAANAGGSGLLGMIGKAGLIGAAGAGGLYVGSKLGEYALEKHDEWDKMKLDTMDAETATLKKRRDAARAGRAAVQTIGLWSSLGINMPGAAGGRSVAAADQALAKAGGNGGQVVFAPQISVGADQTRDQLSANYDKAKPMVLEAWEREQRNRQRVAFSE